MKKVRDIIIAILIPNIVGLIGVLIGNPSSFENIVKPDFAPPAILFPIVWTILFTLMGISSYLIYKSNDLEKDKALLIYIVQLIINGVWSFFFFNQNWFLFSFIWIILLIIVVIIIIYQFFKINKTAALLQIPYLLWLIFASILSYNIYLLN